MNQGPNQFMAHAHVAKDLTEQRTLRDWFAGMALCCTDNNYSVDSASASDVQRTASKCYRLADAMLAERLKGEQE